MQNKELATKLNDMKPKLSFVEDAFLKDVSKYDRPLEINNNIIISGLFNVTQYNNLIDEFWKKNKEVFQNFTRDTIRKDIYDLLNKETQITSEDIGKVYDKYKKTKEKQYWVFGKMNGVIYSGDDYIDFGPYKFFNAKKHKDDIFTLDANIEKHWEMYCEKLSDDIIVGISIKTKEQKRAYEKAKIKFEQLENIFKFMVPDFKKSREMSIINKKKFELTTLYIFGDESAGKSMERIPTGHDPIDLIHLTYNKEDYGINTITSICNKDKLTEIEGRILNSIEWVGRSLSEFEYSKAYIQLMFAVETLLNYNTGENIQPSILSKISESIAFILGENYSEKLKFEKEFKRLYGIRSAITHGRNNDINKGDFTLLLNITRKLIFSFIRNSELKDLKTFSEFQDWIQLKKYSV